MTVSIPTSSKKGHQISITNSTIEVKHKTRLPTFVEIINLINRSRPMIEKMPKCNFPFHNQKFKGLTFFLTHDKYSANYNLYYVKYCGADILNTIISGPFA